MSKASTVADNFLAMLFLHMKSIGYNAVLRSLLFAVVLWNLYLFFAVLLLISVRLTHTGSTFLFTSVTPMSPRLLGSFRRSKSFTFAPMALPKFRAFFRCWLPPVFDPARADVSVKPAGETALLAGRKFSFGCSAALQFSNMLWSTREQNDKMVQTKWDSGDLYWI